MSRVVAAARLHAIHAPVALGVPWLVVGSSFAINLAIWAAMSPEARAAGGTGGLVSLYITVGIVFLQSVTQLFPLAMGLSLTRRTFYLGTLLTAGLQSLVFGVVLTVFTLVENATGGWGVGLSFWAPGRLDVDNPALQVVVFAVPMILASVVGTGLGVVVKRWGQTGMWVLGITSLLLSGLAGVLVTYSGSWRAVGAFFLDAPLAVLVLVVPGLAAVALAGLGFAGLRRAVP
ncbi:hypothetical protein [Modestobacter sp. Leaf380]|uniref:hypothetical protein n=1 Tax=Modestobacter sp. Leaf380 TaxID=1736356 RepID=UPI0006F5BE44|nr:hypothetical protein [Modestobacter sp. Leaf380]KQS71909.1 hypothetical protein ASG41_19610 [Modestobacter sp. Leaf380]